MYRKYRLLLCSLPYGGFPLIRLKDHVCAYSVGLHLIHASQHHTFHQGILFTQILFFPFSFLHAVFASPILAHAQQNSATWVCGEKSDENKFLHQQGAFSFPCCTQERLGGPTVTTLPPCRCGNETGPIYSPASRGELENRGGGLVVGGKRVQLGMQVWRS